MRKENLRIPKRSDRNAARISPLTARDRNGIQSETTNQASSQRARSDKMAEMDLAVEIRRQLGLLIPEEVAAVAGVDVRTLANQRAARTGPPYTKWGKTVLYRTESLTRWLAENEVETQP